MTELKPKIADEVEGLKAAITHILSDKQGILFFRYLMRECGFQAPSTVVHPVTGEINIQRTVYLEARRNLWLHLRQFLSPAKLNQVELLKSKEEIGIKTDPAKQRKLSWQKQKELQKQLLQPPQGWETEKQ